MAAPSRDKILIAAALVLVTISLLIFGLLHWRKSGVVHTPIAQLELPTTPYTPTVAEAGPVRTETWTQPNAQTRGREWVYDAFTPPEIFYNGRTKQFTVKPPSGLTDAETEEPFGLDLVSVRAEPYRLQLIGFVGTDGHWRGTFENLLTGEVFLADSGRAVPALGLTIKRLDVSAQPVALADSMTTRQRVATAVIQDERGGQEVTLTHRARHFTGSLSAVVASSGENDTREVRHGDTFKIGDRTYRIERIQLDPPLVEVTKSGADPSQGERRTLMPREAEETETADSAAKS